MEVIDMAKIRKAKQDIVSVLPETGKVRLENDRVRVVELRSPPANKTPMHSHPDFVMYSMTDSEIKFTYPRKKEEIKYFYFGEVTYFEAGTHAEENIGTIETHNLIIELKQ